MQQEPAAAARHILPKPPIVDKHKCYAAAYQPNDIFWGIGIECEAYIEAADAAQRVIPGAQFYTNQRAERYSVSYYQSYKAGIYNQALKGLIDPSGSYTLPYLLNAHSLSRVDAAGQHTTAFKKVTGIAAPYVDVSPNAAAAADKPTYTLIPNSRCAGPLIDTLAAADPYFKLSDGIRAESFILDGDSIEIATRGFYKTSVEKCVAEFAAMRSEFINRLNAAWTTAQLPAALAPFRWMRTNYPFAIYHSNPQNIGIFNNGTYHINLTIPTKLDGRAIVRDGPLFIKQHRSAARFIQWLEPFLIANYGTADSLSKSPISGHRFSAASQRVAVSRYIGIGSYNTTQMRQGKINSLPRAEVRVTAEDGWMTSYSPESAYVQLEEVGMDINFHKHYNHGLELRFFDYFDEARLEPLLGTLVQAIDHSQALPLTPPPNSAVWNVLVEEVMMRGPKAMIYSCMTGELSALFGLEVRVGTVRQVWGDIQRQLERRWLGRGICSRLMIERRRPLWVHIERPFGAVAIEACIAAAEATDVYELRIPRETATAASKQVIPVNMEPGAVFQVDSPYKRGAKESQPLLPTIPEVGPPVRKKGFWAKLNGCCM